MVLLAQACTGCSTPPEGGCREVDKCVPRTLLEACGAAIAGDNSCPSGYCAVRSSGGGGAKCYQPAGSACRGGGAAGTRQQCRHASRGRRRGVCRLLGPADAGAASPQVTPTVIPAPAAAMSVKLLPLVII